VFDPTSTVSSASLCGGGTATAERTYDSAHYGYISNAIAAARAALSALQSAIRATAATTDDTAADTVKTDVDAAAAANDPAAAATAAQAAVTAFAGLTGATFGEEAAIERYQGQAEAARDRANAARDKVNEHAPFQMRAQVSPGDEEYIVVVAPENSATALTLNFAFHGAVVDTNSAHTTLDGSLGAGDQDVYTINITAPGLLTVETTGSTDTAGMLTGTESAMDDSSGSRNNFKMVVPVLGGTDYIITVDGQDPTTTGDYTLDLDFKVAMGTATVSAGTASAITAAPTWPQSTGLGANSDDSVDALELRREYNNSVDEDYFLLTVSAAGLLTVETQDSNSAETDADTTGTLYGPMGEIKSDSSSGAGNHFKIGVPVEAEKYLVRVGGSDGEYTLQYTLNTATSLADVSGTYPATAADGCTDATDNAYEICPPGAGMPLTVDRYVFNIEEPGALYLRTTGDIDTVGTLYGPNGDEIAGDDNSGAGDNFRIAINVDEGQHLLEVRGKDRDQEGAYGLVTNFVTGAEVEEPTTPPTTTPPPATVDPDPAGVLEEPPSGGIRSGIGLVRGWVCQDDGNGVEIRITGPSGPDSETRTFTAPYGSDRGDVNVSEHCDDRIVNGVGFATQYNYNLLPAGTYTVEAYVGRDRVGLTPGGQTNTFTVARISDAEFLARVPSSGRVLVEDFPVRGTTTILEFDLSSQNFEIQGTQ